MADAQKRLQDLSDEFQSLQSQLQAQIDGRQKLESQQQENKAVQQEFAKLDEDEDIYKLVGPVLLKQEKSEAVEAVERRLEFIEKEIARVEKQIAELQQKGDDTKMEIYQLQQQQQSAQPGQPAA